MPKIRYALYPRDVGETPAGGDGIRRWTFQGNRTVYETEAHTFRRWVLSLGFLILIILLSGCSVRHIDEPLQSPTPVPDKQESRDVARVNPLTDDPDNPSPHNPLIKAFGDVPEVRTYLRLKQKLGRGIGLSIDEAIELYTAEVRLYPTPAAKEMLKVLKTDKKRYERLGIPVRGHLPSYLLDAVVDASE